METNPCYETSNAIYEDMNRGDGDTNEYMTTEEWTNTTCKEDSNEPALFTETEPATFTDTEPKKKTKRRFTVIVAAVFLSFLALTLVAVVAVATTSYMENASLRLKVRILEDELDETQLEANAAQEVLGNYSSQGFASINMRFQNLEEQLIQKTAELISDTQLSSLQSSVDTLNTTTVAQLSSLQSSVDTLNTTTVAQLSNLQSSVNTLNTYRSTSTSQLSSLQSSVNTLNAYRSTSTSQLSSLQTSVNTLNTYRSTSTSQLSSLQSSVNTLNAYRSTSTSQLSNLQSSVNTLNAYRSTSTSQLNSLQSSVNTLTTRVNPPYQNCIQDRGYCTMTVGNDFSTWTLCDTDILPINRTVSVHIETILLPGSHDLDYIHFFGD